MKCAVCGEPMFGATFTVDLLVGDDHCTLNLHQRCMRELVGDLASNKLNALMLKIGWTQIQPSEFHTRHA